MYIIQKINFILLNHDNAKNPNFNITADKTGVVGIHITFEGPTLVPYQLLAYAVYPKLALIDSAGECKIVDNI